MLMKINEKVRGLGKRLQAYARDNKGAAAVEFAIIAPLLITLYLGTQEISLALQVNKKVGRSASAIGDLIAQDDQDPMPVATIRDMMKVGTATLQPYTLTKPEVFVTGINIDSAGAAKVAWSQKLINGTSFSTPYAVNSAVVVPAKLIVKDTFLVKVETKLEYRPITSWSISKNKGTGTGAYAAVDMSEIYYLRPRNTTTISCTGC